jgi:hypothetical protein
MKYYESTLHEAKVKTDAENDQAFIKQDGKERKVPVTNKVVNDAILEGNTISEAQYEKA